MAKYKVKFLIPGSNPGNPTKTKGETMNEIKKNIRFKVDTQGNEYCDDQCGYYTGSDDKPYCALFLKYVSSRCGECERFYPTEAKIKEDWKVDHENLTVNIYDCITDEEFEIYTDEPGRSLSYYFEKDYTFKCKLKGGITIEICDYTMCFKNRATKKNDYVECMADQFRLRESLNILISAYGVEEE